MQKKIINFIKRKSRIIRITFLVVFVFGSNCAAQQINEAEKFDFFMSDSVYRYVRLNQADIILIFNIEVQPFNEDFIKVDKPEALTIIDEKYIRRNFYKILNNNVCLYSSYKYKYRVSIDGIKNIFKVCKLSN